MHSKELDELKHAIADAMKICPRNGYDVETGILSEIERIIIDTLTSLKQYEL